MRRTRRYSRHTLSGKLLLLFFVTAVLVLLLVGGSMRYAFRDHFEASIRPHLLQYLTYVQQDIGDPPNRQRAKQLADKLHVEILIHDAAGDWSSRDRTIKLDAIHIKHQHQIGDSQITLVEVEDVDNYIMVERGGTRLLFGIPEQERELLHGRLLLPLFIVFAVIVLLYHATQRLVAPLHTIRDGVLRFGAGELDHRIEAKGCDELAELARSFNTMAGDIQQMLEAKRQLLLAISHELRSPLTRTKVATELLADAEQRQVLHRDLNEIEKLIDELLETERLATPHRVLNRTAVMLSELIAQVIVDFFQGKDIRFKHTNEKIELMADAARIKLLLKNLLDNALRHSPPGKAVTIELNKTGRGVELQIRDEGDGIEAQHLPHLTEPFYRVDPSRQRETGGYGLGLYLCRMIAEAHGGSLSITSQKGHGTRIAIQIPMNKVSEK